MKKKVLAVSLLFIFLFMSSCSFFGISTTATPTQDQQARGVVSFFQTIGPAALNAAQIFVAAEPQYQSALPGVVLALSSYNQVLAGIEQQGASGQTIVATTILVQLQSQLLNILDVYSTWGNATISGTTSQTAAQKAILAFVAVETVIQTVDTIYNSVSGNLPTWAQLQSQNQLFQTQLTAAGAPPVTPPATS